MALKLNIAADEFDSLADVIKDEYKKSGDGYVLDVSGIEDTGPLKRAKQHESEARKAAEAKVRDLESKISNLESGNDDRIIALQGERESFEKEASRYKSLVEDTTLSKAASDIASKISTSPAVILPHIKSRLSVGFDKDGAPTISVKGPDGKLSQATLDDLGAEFVANADFAAIIKGSGSSGGAGTRTPKAGGPNPHVTRPSDKNPALMNARELAEWTESRRAAREGSAQE